MLYSIMPPEVVFEVLEAGGANGMGTLEETVLVGGPRLLLRRDARGRGVIERIISTEPRDYLDPRLQPGMPHDGPARQ